MIDRVDSERGRAGRPALPRLCVAALLVAALAVGSSTLVGCGGGGGDPAGGGGPAMPAVASVQGRPISRAALVHWMRVKNASLYGVAAPLPDPPGYRHCVAGANALRARSRRPPLPPQKLRERCARVYAQLKDKALAFLITAKWIEGEAAAQGLQMSPSEVQATYHQLRSGPAGRTFSANLRREGMSEADAMLQLRLEHLAQGLRAKIGAGKATIAAYRRRWRQRTSCRAGYVVPDCRNYHAAKKPGT